MNNKEKSTGVILPNTKLKDESTEKVDFSYFNCEPYRKSIDIVFYI